MPIGGVSNRVIEVSVGLLIAALLLPTALFTMANATFTKVDPTVKIVVTILLPILAVLGIAMTFWHETG
jgi:uncharacterized membrane protein